MIPADTGKKGMGMYTYHHIIGSKYSTFLPDCCGCILHNSGALNQRKALTRMEERFPFVEHVHLCTLVRCVMHYVHTCVCTASVSDDPTTQVSRQDELHTYLCMP